MKTSEMPDMLMSYAWAGSLPAKLLRAYPKPVMWAFSIILVFGVGVSAIAWGLTGDHRHLYLAIPMTTWLTSFALPFIYARSVRHVRIVTPKQRPPDEIDINHWWKKDCAGLDEHEARYENGRRVFWLSKPTPTEDDPDPELKYFSPEESHIQAVSNAEVVDSSEVFGLAGWVASGSSYVFTKARSTREIIHMGLLAGIIIAELIAIFMLTGRFSEDASGVVQVQDQGTVQTRPTER